MWAHYLVIMLLLMLAACGTEQKVTEATQPPPITLAAPPTINLTGSCDNTKDLETWLQTTTQLATNFQSQMNAAVIATRQELYQYVINLAALRDFAFAAAAPDCVVEPHLTLNDAMSRVVTTLQAYFNGDQPEIGNVVTEANARIDEVITIQADLLNQMNAQFQQQRLETPTT